MYPLASCEFLGLNLSWKNSVRLTVCEGTTQPTFACHPLSDILGTTRRNQPSCRIDHTWLENIQCPAANRILEIFGVPALLLVGHRPRCQRQNQRCMCHQSKAHPNKDTLICSEVPYCQRNSDQVPGPFRPTVSIEDCLFTVELNDLEVNGILLCICS